MSEIKYVEKKPLVMTWLLQAAQELAAAEQAREAARAALNEAQWEFDKAEESLRLADDGYRGIAAYADEVYERQEESV